MKRLGHIATRYVVASIFLIASAMAQAGSSLFSDAEAQHLRYSDEGWQGLGEMRDGQASRGLADGPDIVFERPYPVSGDGNSVTLHSPSDLVIVFKEKSAPVNMDSLVVTAEKGFISLPLTSRLTPYVKGNRIVAEKLEIPEGKFVIEISVADQQGNTTAVKYRFDVQ